MVALLVSISIFSSSQVGAANTVNIYFFRGEGCPHCAKEEIFLEELKSRYPSMKVSDYEVWYNKNNQELLTKVAEKLNVKVSGVPFTIIGDKTFFGFSESATGPAMEARVKEGLESTLPDSVADTIKAETSKPVADPQPEPGAGSLQPIPMAPDPKSEDNSEDNSIKQNDIPDSVQVPFIGDIKTKNLSLPLLAVVFGTLDGFNPCAMWTLIFLISLLIGMNDRKRMWILGSAFIIASASVYFLFMAAWLNLLLIIGLVTSIRALIGLVALGGGGFNIREYFKSKEIACKVTNHKKRRRIFEKLKEITLEKKFLLALGGIILLAVAVNLVELFCSAGLPAIFTQILTLSNLAQWQYYGYILLYIFFFMLDDLLVFFIAMTTLRVAGVTTKYTRFSHLIGGILMVIIGLLLLFKPEILMFG